MTVQNEPTPQFYSPDFEHLLACDKLHSKLIEASEQLELFRPDTEEFTFEGVPAGRSRLARLEGTYTREGEAIRDAYLRFSGINPDSDKRQHRFTRNKQNPLEWQIGDNTRDNAGMIRHLQRNLGIDKFDTDTWLIGTDLEQPVSDSDVALLLGDLGTTHGTAHEITRTFKTFPDQSTNRDEIRKGAALAVIDGTEHQRSMVIVEIDVPFELAGGIVPLHVTVGAMPDGVIDMRITATTPNGSLMTYYAEDFPEVVDLVLERVDELIETKTQELYAA